MRALILVLGLLAPALTLRADLGQILGWTCSAQDPNGAYLLLSDIHFDPFVDPALVPALAAAPAASWDGILAGSTRTDFPGYKDDTNGPLWRSALGALALAGVHYDYAIVTGDILAHGFEQKFNALHLGGPDAYEAFVAKTLQYVGISLAARLPGTPLYWALGNNDSECGDYGIVPRGKLLADLAHDWTSVAGNTQATLDFAQAGCYEVALPGNAGRFISLDTVLWSRRRSTRCVDAAADSTTAAAALGWLEAHLRADAAAGLRVTLGMHIPPGLSAFQSICGLPQEAFLKPEMQDPLLDLLSRYAGTLRLLFAGHTHFDDFRVYSREGRGQVGMHLIPSIGPNHGNNPSFQVGLYRRLDGETLDLATYTLRNLKRAGRGGEEGDWTFEYGFKLAYGQDFNVNGIAALTQAIRAKDPSRDLFEAFYAGESPTKAALDPSQWLPYSCAQTCFTPEDFAACACSAKGPGQP